MLCWQDIIYTEVCDPQTFHRVRYGERGTPVYTHLERTSQPMIRLVSGDLTLWENGPNPCGRTYPRLPQGIFGRIDDMFTIRGENVYPSEVDAVMNQLGGYGGEHRIVITRDGAMDELLIRIEAASARAGPGRNRTRDVARRGRTEAAEDARAAREGRNRAAGHLPAHRFQGAARDRRSRRVPRNERAAREVADDVRPVPRACAGVLAGDLRAIARLLTRAERRRRRVSSALDAIFRHAGRAHVVGITGVPGSGKSTLVAKLAAAVRATARTARDRRGRSLEPFFRRRDPGRPHPHGRSCGRRRGVRAQHGDARRAGRPRAWHARERSTCSTPRASTL